MLADNQVKPPPSEEEIRKAEEEKLRREAKVRGT